MLTESLTSPTILFFVLGMVARSLKSDLEVPAPSSKFISLYLLLSIGFKGGQELSHSQFNSSIILSIVFGIGISAIIPVYVFFLLRRRLGPQNAGAIAAAYGSVSAVTFVAATGFLEAHGLRFGGHMVAIMALMESPAIVVGMVLLKKYDAGGADGSSLKEVVRHSITNGSVMLLMGSLAIGLLADAKQAEGIRPFTTDIFKGFLSIFLLEMGMVTAGRFSGIRKYGPSPLVSAVLFPLVNGSVVALASGLVTNVVGDRLMFAVLAASASYIAVPAAMRLAAPAADPGLYLPMALGITFPVNLTVGMPLYLMVVERS